MMAVLASAEGVKKNLFKEGNELPNTHKCINSGQDHAYHTSLSWNINGIKPHDCTV
jgi:hypothetical protein